MTGPVTESAALRHFDDVLQDTGLRAAVAYWDDLRLDRLLPSRMDLDPSTFRPHLASAAIIEVVQQGSLRIRLGGSRLNDLLGMDVRGLPLRTLFDLAERAEVSATVEAAIAAPHALVLDVASPAARFGSPHSAILRSQVAILPMTDTGFAPTRALYAMGEVVGQPRAAQTPYRWCIQDIHRVALQAGAPVLAHAPRPRRPAPVQSGTAPGNRTPQRTPVAPPRFRVIEGGLS